MIEELNNNEIVKRKNMPRNRKIMKYHKVGVPVDDIGKIYGISGARVHQIIKKMEKEAKGA